MGFRGSRRSPTAFNAIAHPRETSLEHKVVPVTSTCTPIGKRLAERLGPYHGFAQAGAPERPLFSAEEARRIAEDWRALPPAEGGAQYEAHYNSTRKLFRFFDPEKGAWYEWGGEGAGVATLYPIGEGAWKWDCA
jgi:hypothetical protein